MDRKGEVKMDFLQLVKKNYRFHKVERIDETTLQTEVGKKKVYFWKDRKLLDWHIDWRDQCNVHGQILTNRMLRTIDEKADVEWQEGWFTLHDEVTTLAPMKGKEEIWARLLTNLFHFGMEHESYTSLAEKRDLPTFEEASSTILKANLPIEKKNILLGCLKESDVRLKKAVNILDNTELDIVVDPIYSIEQGKAIFDMLYWEGTNERPEKGLRSFAKFLYEWYLNNGAQSTEKLLNEMNRILPMQENFKKLLIGEMLIPWELDEFLQTIESSPIEENYERFISNWEKKRQLVNLLGKWYVEERKKVAT